MTTNTARLAAFAEETGEAWLILVAISHPDMDGTLRACNNATDIVSGGETYFALPFSIALPADTNDSLPQATLRIDNVGREVSETIRTLTTAPTVTLSVVLASQPDIIEVGPLDFRLSSAEVDAVEVSGTLAWESILAEPFPADTFLPSTHFGLF